MKHSHLLFIVIAVSIIFFGCSKNDYQNPAVDHNNGHAGTLKAGIIKIAFEGVCTPISLSPVNTWYDATDDTRVRGTSIWFTDEVNVIDEITVELKGRAELTLDNDLGKWETNWWGTQTLTSPDGSTFKIIAHAVGTGVEGEVMGMTAKWKYSLDFDGTPETLKYYIKGKIDLSH